MHIWKLMQSGQKAQASMERMAKEARKNRKERTRARRARKESSRPICRQEKMEEERKERQTSLEKGKESNASIVVDLVTEQRTAGPPRRSTKWKSSEDGED